MHSLLYRCSLLFVFVDLSFPDSYENPLATPIYGLDGTLSKITVSWKLPNGLCVNDKYSFGARLKNGSNILDEEIIMCTTQHVNCNVTFDITCQTIVDNYSVEIISLDCRGGNAPKFNSGPINYISSIQPNNSVEFFPCSVRCLSSFSGTCVIQYFQKKINGSLNGTVNSGDIGMPEKLQSGTVYFTAIFNVNGSSYLVQNFTDVQYNIKWTGEVWDLVALGMLFIIIGFIMIIPIISRLCVQWKTFKEEKILKVVIVNAVLLSVICVIISFICWIAGLVENVISDRCSNLDQPLRILIAAVVFSIFCIIFELIAIIGLVQVVSNSKQKKLEQRSTNETTIQVHCCIVHMIVIMKKRLITVDVPGNDDITVTYGKEYAEPMERANMNARRPLTGNVNRNQDKGKKKNTKTESSV